MNIMRKYSRKSLRKNRTQTVVTIIGIAISMAMLTAVILGAQSGISYIRQIIIKSEGAYHGYYESIDQARLEEVKKNPDFEQTAIWQEVGISRPAKSESGKRQGSDTLSVVPADDERQTAPSQPSEKTGEKIQSLEPIGEDYYDYFQVFALSEQKDDQLNIDLAGIKIVKGGMPKNNREILLPEFFSRKDRGAYKVGDLIQLDLGDRVNSKGEKVPFSSPYLMDFNGNVAENLAIYAQKTYRISGFIAPTYYGGSMDAGTCALTRGEGSGSYRAFFTFKEPAKMADAYINQEDALFLHTRLMQSYGSVFGDQTRAMIYGFAVAMILIIGLGAVFLISNSISISLTERTRQYGMLNSIGATRKQIYSSIMDEGLYLGGLGTLFGLLIGWAGCSVYFWYLRKNMPEFALYEYAPGHSLALTVDLSPKAILIAVILCLLVTLLSVRRPARRASKLSPIQAIRQSEDIRMDLSKADEKKLEKTAAVSKSFGIEKVIAKKNFLRNKQNWKAPVRALALSIILFVSAASLIAVVDQIVDRESLDDGDQDLTYMIFMGEGDPNKKETGQKADKPKKEVLKEEMTHAEEMWGKISRAKGVKNSCLSYSYQTEIRLNNEDLDPDFLAYMKSMAYVWNDEKGDYFTYPMDLLFLNDEDFKAYLKENGIDPTPYLESEQPLGLVYDRTILTEENGKRKDQFIFQKKDLSSEMAYIVRSAEEQKEFFPVRVNEIIRKPAFGRIASAAYIAYPMSRFWELYQPVVDRDNNHLMAMIASTINNNDYSNESVESLSKEDPSDHIFHNNYEDRMLIRRFISMIRTFTGTFMVLIALVSLANMFNTISSNILLRKKEFSVLVSIGMSREQFMRMIRYEGWTYGLRSLVWSLPIACLASYGIYRLMHVEDQNIPFSFPWPSLIISAIVALIMVFISIAYTVRKLDLDHPMEWTKGAVD